MGINEQYFSAAMERLEERRRANRLESDMRRSEVESKIPEYRELSLKLGETGSEIVRLVMRGGDTSKELAEVERRNLEIQKRLAELLYENDITQCVFSPEYARALSESAVTGGFKLKIHIKIDTGMGRIGFDCRDSELSGIEDAITAARLPGFILDGIFTHFCVSDRTAEEEDGFTDLQFSRFTAAVTRFKEAGLNPRVCHCCNSAALCLDKNKHLDMCRPGIILYGLTPAYGLKLKEDFIPVMTVKSVVSMVKTVKKGTCVSYGKTFTAQKDMKIATVTAGYADGYPRALSNKGRVIIRGKSANIIGRICMDQMSVDVTDIEDVKQGDEVVLFGKELPVEEIAEKCGTINYEITCGISQRVPRIPINGR